ncbi:ABC transporter permease [Streptomyces roseifaciens]|uniref:ABC transporter permease n=1 Tax=Streptomyces roseifaciens TaxID=1488406 RepID=UPI00071824DB|nr:ABC transporter permease [Streptomyces roseifaciens]
MNALARVASDSGAVAWRNLLTIRRTPGAVLASTVQPVVFVLLLGYVFGSSLGGAAYREFLMGGIFVQTVAFNASFTAVGLAEDLQSGIVDRFRSLPMSRVAVLLGRTVSDLTMNAVSLLVTSMCGLAVGWRVHGPPLDAVLGYALLLLFAFAMSWTGAVIGLVARSAEVAQSLGLIWLFPVTFVSSGFVSVAAMPRPLATVAEWNPVTGLANATRALFGNATPPNLAQPAGWPAQHALMYGTLCSLAIIAVAMTWATARYRRIAHR